MAGVGSTYGREVGGTRQNWAKTVTAFYSPSPTPSEGARLCHPSPCVGSVLAAFPPYALLRLHPILSVGALPLSVLPLLVLCVFGSQRQGKLLGQKVGRR